MILSFSFFFFFFFLSCWSGEFVFSFRCDVHKFLRMKMRMLWLCLLVFVGTTVAADSCSGAGIYFLSFSPFPHEQDYLFVV